MQARNDAQQCVNVLLSDPQHAVLFCCAAAVLLLCMQARNDAQHCATVLLSDPRRAVLLSVPALL
jgi:hypothetical protein